MGLLEEYFKGKTFIVSGVGRGQGLATLRLLAGMEANVIALSRSGSLDVEFSQKEKERIKFFKVDASSEHDVKGFAQKISDYRNKISGMVSNAGIWEPADEKLSSPENMEKFFRSNTMSQYNILYHILPFLGDNGSAIIIGASRNLFGGNHSAYTVSKFALEEVTRSFASEYFHKGVRVNSILPGGVSKDDNFGKIYPFNFPKKDGPIESLQIAYISSFLLSPLSSAINGQCITADKGMGLS